MAPLWRATRTQAVAAHCVYFGLAYDIGNLNRRSCANAVHPDPNGHDAWCGLRQGVRCCAPIPGGVAVAFGRFT